VLTRNASRRREISLYKGAELKEADVHDVEVLSRAISGADAVISMAGILNETGFSGKGFEKVHLELVDKILQACKQEGVTRLLHISALNAGKGNSHYLRSKGKAEELLLAEAGIQTTIFQPSVIFGPGDAFFNRFAGLLSLTPVLPLACAGSRMQPVFAGDVARVVAQSLEARSTAGNRYELGGPNIYTLLELVKFTADTVGKKVWVIPLPDIISRLQGAVMGLVPGKPFSTDNYRSLQTDNVCAHNALPDFGIVPASIEAVVPDYLGESLRQRRYSRVRKRAKR
jgi:NADH dehydrogenase